VAQTAEHLARASEMRNLYILENLKSYFCTRRCRW